MLNKDDKIYYVSLGDNLALGENPYQECGYGYSDIVKDYLQNNQILKGYVKEFAKKEYKITDLNKDLNNNIIKIVDNKKLGLKHALNNSSLVTISIGTSEILEIINNKKEIKNIDDIINNYSILIENLKKYAQREIMIIGYYTNNEENNIYIEYANNKLYNLAQEYKLIYIDVHKLFKNEYDTYFPNPSSIYPNILGYKLIGNEIIENLKK